MAPYGGVVRAALTHKCRYLMLHPERGKASHCGIEGLKGVERRPLPTYIIAHICECDGVEVAPYGGVVRAALMCKSVGTLCYV